MGFGNKRWVDTSAEKETHGRLIAITHIRKAIVTILPYLGRIRRHAERGRCIPLIIAFKDAMHHPHPQFQAMVSATNKAVSLEHRRRPLINASAAFAFIRRSACIKGQPQAIAQMAVSRKARIEICANNARCASILVIYGTPRFFLCHQQCCKQCKGNS